MEIQNKIGEQVFDKLRSKFKQITLGDTDGNATQNPTEAVFFNFNYIDEEGHDHGNITVSLIDRTMKIYYSKNISKDLKGSELSEWYEFLQDMRKTAKSQLYGFDTHDISKSALDIQDINATVKRNDVAEGKMYGSKKRSYQDQGPAKIIVRHTENIDSEVRGSRSRKVESVFVETVEGERFKMPFNNLPGTRAMAQHIGQGGRPYDEIGESISLMVSEIASLRPFVSRNRNAIYEDETTMQMVEAAKEYYAEARKSLGKLKGKRGYKAYAESFQVTEQELFGDDDASSMKDRFTKKRFSDKMEAAMPVVKKAYSLKNMKPKSPGMKPVKPITEFEEWTEEVTALPEKVTEVIAEDCASILSDEEKQQIKAWINNQIDDLDDELFEKLFQHYLNNGEMPYGTAKARTGDPYQWMFDRMDQEYGRHTDYPGNGISEAEEMCSTECCGKPVSQCHCGPECPHCDCFTKNSLKTSKKIAKGWAKSIKPTLTDGDNIPHARYARHARAQGQTEYTVNGVTYKVSPKEPTKILDEVKSGNFNSKVIGRRVKIQGSDDFGSNEHSGKEGTVSRATREHTFSQMVPFKVIYGVKLDDGGRISVRRENVRVLKATSQAPVNEQQLDEGILQGVFNFMWNMTGKLPGVSDRRQSKQRAAEFNRFKEKMDDATIDQWLTELSSKLNSSHSATAKASTGRLETIRKRIQEVKKSNGEINFVINMNKLHSELNKYKKFIQSSNSGVANRKRAARIKKKLNAPSKKTASDNKLAKWVQDGGEELAKPNRRGHGSNPTLPKGGNAERRQKEIDKRKTKESVNEGTWAIPDTPDKIERLQELLSQPLAYGVDGDNASSALYDLIGDDDLFDNLADDANFAGPEADARMTILSHMEDIVRQDSGEWGAGSDSPAELIQAFVSLYDPNSGSSGGIFGESITEGSQLTDNVTATLINRLESKFPDVFKRHGSEYIYDLVRDEVSWLTDEWPEDQGFGTSDSFGAWKNVLAQLGININNRGEVEESLNEYGKEDAQHAGVTSRKNQAIQFIEKNAQVNIGPNVSAEEDYTASGVYMVTGLIDDVGNDTRAIVYMPGTAMGGKHGDFELEESLREDVILPKATYSDYLEVYKSGDVSGTDSSGDAEAMVKALKKKGKGANVNAAKGALKRMAEAEAKKGLHINESLNDLRRQAGIIK